MSDLVVSLVLAITQVKEQLAVGNVTDIIVGNRSTLSMAVGPGCDGILDSTGVFEDRLKGEVYRGCGARDLKSEVRQGI
jgi:hypothetical protein